MKGVTLGIMMFLVGLILFMYGNGTIPIDFGFTGALDNFVDMATDVLSIALLGGGIGVIAMSKGR